MPVESFLVLREVNLDQFSHVMKLHQKVAKHTKNSFVTIKKTLCTWCFRGKKT